MKVKQLLGYMAFRLGGPFVLPFALHNSKRARVWIEADSHVLLVRSVIGGMRWNMPGGGIEKNETAINAAAREVAEELQITLQPDQLQRLFEERYKGYCATYDLVYFMAVLSQQPVVQAQKNEIAEWRWFSYKELASEARLHDNVQSVLQRKVIPRLD